MDGGQFSGVRAGSDWRKKQDVSTVSPGEDAMR
jgi:hypothetical protein